MVSKWKHKYTRDYYNVKDYMTPEKQELILRMENLLNIPYSSNPYFKTAEIWRAALTSKLNELKKLK